MAYYTMVKKGYISEVFGSFQGEGPYVGERHVFVRFCGCNLDCSYCDTRYALERPPFARVECGPGGQAASLPNPLTVHDVVRAVMSQEVVPGFNSAVSVTGGEPLLQAGFLRDLLAGLDGRFRVLLETNGTLAGAFMKVRDKVDVVSMDIKLPSASGTGSLWRKHACFLDACAGMEVVVKAVVSPDTPVGEVERAARLVAERAEGSLFVIQPVSVGGVSMHDMGVRFEDYYMAAKAFVKRVRVIPQMHGCLGVK